MVRGLGCVCDAEPPTSSEQLFRLQALLSASETICVRLRQLGVQDDDIDESARIIERAVMRSDTIVRGK